MPNSYYNNDNAPVNATKANAQNEDADRDALEAAFDLLPSPTDIARGELNYQGTDTGAVNAYAVAITRITALANGQRVTFVPAATNTAASTLNVSALGASAILALDGSALGAGEIVANRPAVVIRHGTNWFLQNTAVNASARVAAAAASASSAAASALAAQASADAADATANAVLWVSGTTYPLGFNVYSPIDYKTYRRIIAGAGTTDPSLDAVNWTAVSGGLRLAISRRTSNTALAATDKGTFVIVTSGTFTQTRDTIENLGPDWFAYYQNAGTGNITITTDGVTYVMYPGEMRLLFINAALDGLDSRVLNSFEVTFNSSGTFTKPPGYLSFPGVAHSAGASGARDASAAKGGHGGGAFPFDIPYDDMSTTETITVGAGGASRTTDGVPNAGGDSAVGTLVVVKGASATVSGAVSLGGAALSLDAVGVGFDGVNEATSNGRSAVWGGATSEADAGGASGSSIYGGAAGGSHDGTLRAAGTSIFGGDGGAAGDATNGADGQQPGGGGGATRTGTQSGKGGDGRVVIRGKF
jgi:hypothetical protein